VSQARGPVVPLWYEARPRRIRQPARVGWLGLLLALGCWLAPLPAAAQTPRPELIEPIDPGRWISNLWAPVASYGGLLTDDALEDVVILVRRREAFGDDPLRPSGSRALAIFSLTDAGVYRREVLAEDILPCVQCMGTINRDPDAVPFEIDIADHQLTVSWISNADGLVSVRLTLAWDAREQAFGLVADEVVRGDEQRGIASRRLRDYRGGRAVTERYSERLHPAFHPCRAGEGGGLPVISPSNVISLRP